MIIMNSKKKKIWRLKIFCPTRWVESQEATEFFVSMYRPIVVACERLSLGQFGPVIAGKCLAFLRSISTPSFLISMFTLSLCLSTARLVPLPIRFLRQEAYGKRNLYIPRALHPVWLSVPILPTNLHLNIINEQYFCLSLIPFYPNWDKDFQSIKMRGRVYSACFLKSFEMNPLILEKLRSWMIFTAFTCQVIWPNWQRSTKDGWPFRSVNKNRLTALKNLQNLQLKHMKSAII